MRVPSHSLEVQKKVNWWNRKLFGRRGLDGSAERTGWGQSESEPREFENHITWLGLEELGYGRFGKLLCCTLLLSNRLRGFLRLHLSPVAIVRYMILFVAARLNGDASKH